MELGSGERQDRKWRIPTRRMTGRAMLGKTGPRSSLPMASSLYRLMSVVWKDRDGVFVAENDLGDEMGRLSRRVLLYCYVFKGQEGDMLYADVLQNVW